MFSVQLDTFNNHVATVTVMLKIDNNINFI